MAEKQKNQIVVVEPVTKTVSDLLQSITEKDLAQISQFQNADEAVQCARQFVPCMLVLCIQSNNDIPPILNTLKKLKPDIKQGHVKTLLVSKIKNSQLQKLIGEFGVTDYIEEPISPRTLMFKANLQLKAVDTTRRQMELKKQSEEKIVFKSSKKSDDDSQNAGNDVKTRNKPALQLANDTFLIKNSVVKKQAKKYVVELDGPDPSTGEWVPEGTDPANPAWRWKPADKEDEPGSEEGDGWVASGEKPQFKAAAKKWQLSAEKPALFFKKKNLKVAEKIAVDAEGEVTVAEDSPAAEENLRKNLKKAERQKKKKQAEAAGIPLAEDEPEKAQSTKAPASADEEEDADDASLDPVARAQRKAKREKKAAARPGKAEKTEAVEEGAAEAESAEPAAARQKLEKMRKARLERKQAALEAGLPVDPADDEEPKIEAGESEEETEEPGTTGALHTKKKNKKSAAKGEGQLLDFLKKKKAAVKPAGQEEKTEAEDAEIESEETPAGRAARLKRRQRAKKAKAGAEDPSDPLADEDEDILEKTQEAEEDEEEEAEISAAVAEAESAVEAEHAEKARHLKERKRKREAKKKALLEEIQAESEPTEEEIETAEKKRIAKASGVENEKTPEETQRNPRLEKLRKKRAELDELELESEEDEAQGLALHSSKEDELRGINVWDTDETAPPDESPAEKLLKKLKKERKEKAEAKAKKEAEAAGLDELAENAAPESKEKKKKKKVGVPTQADGLEDIFAKEEESEVSDDLYDQEGKAAAKEEAEEASESRNGRLDRLRKKRDAAKADTQINPEEPRNEAVADLEAEETEAPQPEAEENATPKKKEDRAAGTEEDGSREQEVSQKGFSEAESIEQEKKEARPVTVAEKLKKKSESSEAMKRFLERRKQKKDSPELTESKEAAKNLAAPEEEANQKRSFLGIFVAISDSFGIASEKKLLNIFRAFESALENCAVALTEPATPAGSMRVIFASAIVKGTQLPVPECHLENFLDSEDKLVAHLALRILAPRTNFAEDESEAISKAVRALRPLILQWLAQDSEKDRKVA